MDIEQLIRNFNAKVSELSETIGTLKERCSQLEQDKNALLVERQLYLDDMDYVVTFDADFDTAH